MVGVKGRGLPSRGSWVALVGREVSSRASLVGVKGQSASGSNIVSRACRLSSLGKGSFVAIEISPIEIVLGLGSPRAAIRLPQD